MVNGIAEELFFRGAMYAAIPRHQVVITTVAYTVATLATGNVMLGFAAILLGVVVGLQRRATGGILAPILTHLVWSVAMLYALPAIFLGTRLAVLVPLLERAAYGLLVGQRLARAPPRGSTAR